MLLAVNIGRSCDGHCRTRRRYPIRCLRLTNSSVILGLTRNASLHVRDSVRSYAPYTQKTLAFRVLFYKECEQIASAYAWSGARSWRVVEVVTSKSQSSLSLLRNAI